MKEISAGGVVFRREDDDMQILMIRDRYGKVTLPKGKMEPGETLEQTALREILEETGIVGQLGPMLEVIRYQYRRDDGQVMDKEVHYYLVEATGGKLRAQEEEIHSAQWVTPQMAWRRQAEEGYRNNDSVMKQALLALNVEI